ncbi:uncharacterized protein LOC128158800 isoform X2 [Crassostrea angulata]|nr:uncharacterized protein LOC128158188 isoform X2 [Crassostrea angulata]XP_052677716.1 uncharacterized protein LOC128158800 isoform X2 [Crassostrea angulata]
MGPSRSIVLVAITFLMLSCQPPSVTGSTTEATNSTSTLTMSITIPISPSDAQTTPKTAPTSLLTYAQTTPSSPSTDAQSTSKTTTISSTDARVTPILTAIDPQTTSETTQISSSAAAQNTTISSPTHAHTSVNDINITNRAVADSTTTPILSTSTTVEKIFPENSQIIEKLLQAFGEEFLKLLGSLSLRCAVNRFILGYSDLLANGCSSEALQNVATTIQEICTDEQTTCLLSQQKSERNGIQVCIDSTVRTNPCPEVVVSDQRYCGDFYVYTLNCTVLQQSSPTVASTTLMTPAAQTVTDKNSNTTAARYAGAALGGFLGGILVTSLVLYFVYQHRRKMEKQRASLSSNNFPNLHRPLPRIESGVYNKIEDMHDARKGRINPIWVNQNYDSHFHGGGTVENQNVLGQSAMKKCDSCAKGFYTFDPRKSVDEGVLQAPTRFGKLSPILPRNNSSSHGLDIMGYLTPGKLLAKTEGSNCADDCRRADDVSNVERIRGEEETEIGIAPTNQDALGIPNNVDTVNNVSASVNDTNTMADGEPGVTFSIDETGIVNEAFEEDTAGSDSAGKGALEEVEKVGLEPSNDVDCETVVSDEVTNKEIESCRNPDKSLVEGKFPEEVIKEEEPLYHLLEKFPEKVVSDGVPKQEEEMNEIITKEQEVSDGK